jgi:glycosyltransferase involved in cell wall biosynthesis
MKILHIINSLNTGGAEKLVLDTVPLYNQKGIKTDVLVFDGFQYPFYKKLKEFNCCQLFSLNARNIYNPLLIFKIIPYIRKYDLVHVHLFPAQYWAVLAKLISFSGVKMFFTEHNTTNRRMQSNSSFFKKIDKLTYKGFDKIVCITEEIQSVLINYSGLKKHDFLVIENGVNLDIINKAIVKEKKEISDKIKINDKIILQVAGFREQKDQQTLIRAMKLLPEDFKLLLVGDGVTRGNCEQLVIQLNLKNRVVFLGVRGDVPSLLKSADIVVLSSKYEGLSLSSIEGMASGKPFIASDVPGLNEVVKGAGLLFKLGDEKELAQHILELMGDTEYYHKIASQCMQRASNYDIHKMVDKHIALYKSLLNET